MKPPTQQQQPKTQPTTQIRSGSPVIPALQAKFAAQSAQEHGGAGAGRPKSGLTNNPLKTAGGGTRETGNDVNSPQLETMAVLEQLSAIQRVT
jgi:hypothetical protein